MHVIPVGYRPFTVMTRRYTISQCTDTMAALDSAFSEGQSTMHNWVLVMERTQVQFNCSWAFVRTLTRIAVFLSFRPTASTQR